MRTSARARSRGAHGRGVAGLRLGGLLLGGLLWSSGCSSRLSEPELAARAWVEAVMAGNEAAVLELASPALRRAAEASAEIATNHVGGRRTIEPIEVVQVRSTARMFQLARTELVSEEATRAQVRLHGADGSSVLMPLIRVDGLWRLEDGQLVNVSGSSSYAPVRAGAGALLGDGGREDLPLPSAPAAAGVATPDPPALDPLLKPPAEDHVVPGEELLMGPSSGGGKGAAGAPGGADTPPPAATSRLPADARPSRAPREDEAAEDGDADDADAATADRSPDEAPTGTTRDPRAPTDARATDMRLGTDGEAAPPRATPQPPRTREGDEGSPAAHGEPGTGDQRLDP